MKLAHSYRLSLKKAQHRALERMLEDQRLLYNFALHERIDAWKRARKSITLYDQMKSLTEMRSEPLLVDMAAIPANVQRWTVKKLDSAMRAFFTRAKQQEGKAGIPRFKPASRWSSFGFAEFSGIRMVGAKLILKGIPGKLRLNMHRPLPVGSSIRSCVFTQDHKGWRVALQLDVPDVEQGVLQTAVGVDLGLSVFATCSDGHVVQPPRFERRAEKLVAERRRAVSRCKRGSNRRKKVKLQLSRATAKVANRRDTFLHQQSAALVRRADVVVLEDLSVRDMVRNPFLARSISDAGWRTFIQRCVYKAERAGGRCVQVNPRGTSQRCATCGETVRKTLAMRVHTCPHCGFTADRDWNASLNIVQIGLKGPEYQAVVGLGLGALLVTPAVVKPGHVRGGKPPRPTGNIRMTSRPDMAGISNWDTTKGRRNGTRCRCFFRTLRQVS